MIINNIKIVLPDREIEKGSIILKNNIIEHINTKPDNSDVEIFDASNLIAIPGLIDLHIHGAGGLSITDKTDNSLPELSKKLAGLGTTGFLWTTMAVPVEEMDWIMKQVADFKHEGGAFCHGVNIEGSFISPQRCGSHLPDFILEPDINYIDRWQKISGNKIKIVTVAPERVPEDFIKGLTDRKIIPSIGHSAADYEQTLKALEAGAGYFTHLGNATGMIHQRIPGLVSAALLDDKSVIEIICDGVHLHPAVVQIFVKLKGWDKVVLVSDGTCVLGMPPGTYKWYDSEVIFDGESLKLPDHTIAGGAMPLGKALGKLMKFTGCSLSTATRMSSLKPARILGIDEICGSIAPGKSADIVLINKDFEVIYTFVAGKLVYSKWNTLLQET